MNTWSKDTDFIIVSQLFEEDLLSRDWLYKNFFNVPIVLYRKGTDVPFHGLEASTYLKFICNNYNNLPKSIMFLYGDEAAWHQNNRNIIKWQQKLNESPNFIKKNPYVNLNTTDYDDRILGNNPAMDLLCELWNEYFKPHFQRDCPNYVRHLCCAQFVVQRPLIEKIPLETFQKWYELSINENYDNFLIARVFEYIWHMIFGLPDVVKPSERETIFV
jgi:hypothetical protein